MPLDHSQLTSYWRCPLQYRLRYREQQARLDLTEHGLPLLAGSAFHAGVACLNRGGSLVEADHLVSQEYTTVPTETLAHLLEAQPVYRLVNVQEAVRGYLEYATRTWPERTVLRTEQPYTWQEPGWGQPYLVKRDAVWELPGGVYGVEYKTTGKPADFSFYRKFDFSNQVSGIQRAIEQEVGSCEGVLVIVVSWKYLKRASYGQPPGFHVSLSHQEFRRTPRQLDQWSRNLGLWMETIQAAQETGLYGQVLDSCDWCEFNDYCQSGCDPQVLASLYGPADTLAYQKE